MLEAGGRRRTPYIPQNEASECALACLGMVAGHYGFRTDLIELRQRFGLSLKGATLKQVIQVAEAIGFNARPLRGEIADLPHLTLPAILHWNLNHFVVLTRIGEGLRGRRFHIHDPARGPLILSEAEVSQSFTGVAVDLLKSEAFLPKPQAPQLRIGQLWSSMRGFWQSIGQVLALSLILQIVVLATPFFMQISVDSVFPSFDHDLLAMLALGFGGLALINFMAGWLRELVLLTLTNALSYQVVINLFRHLMRLPLPWFEKRHVGDIIQRFGSTQTIAQLLSQGMISGFVDGVMALLTLALMFAYSPLLCGIALAALSVYAVVRLMFLQAMKLRNFDTIATAARENSALIESVRGIAAIKAFGREGDRQRLWQKKKADAVNAQIRLGRLSAGFDAANRLVLDLEGVAFVYIAISLALDAKLTLGMLFGFQAYKQQFLGAAMRLVDQAMNFRIIQVHLGRIADIVMTRREDAGEVPSGEVPNFDQPIEVRNVFYRYGVGEADVLKGASLRIEPGEMVALVGPSGGGKTTLMKIMMGLFEPVHGEVLIGGRPASTFSRQAYRRSIGSIAQDDSLYAGSLAENIAFFDPEIDMARVEEAARLACIHDDIDRMPLRYDTLVGDMGSVLSGGQKQRVLLARALYGRPRMLFIDEGTAHLDPETEAKVLASLSSLNITRIMIAHRAQSVAAAGRVLVVADGQIQPMRFNNVSNMAGAGQ
ncbi:MULTISPECIES: peptidase domain-containing ABC transporter [unclassified Sphingomonas]|nr:MULTISPECIES: peptidase domain-containing ABC transporter [unclassified Sphingomonas]